MTSIKLHFCFCKKKKKTVQIVATLSDVTKGSIGVKKLPQTVYVCVLSPRKENLCRLISLILLIKNHLQSIWVTVASLFIPLPAGSSLWNVYLKWKLSPRIDGGWVWAVSGAPPLMLLVCVPVRPHRPATVVSIHSKPGCLVRSEHPVQLATQSYLYSAAVWNRKTQQSEASRSV